jgi:NAD(P)-dependent dehydrogenase (short-subunit alcohol dehydrogenase family)
MTKIALVPGASRGLGRNTALRIARHGGDVILTYQSRGEDAQAAVAEINAMGRKAIAFHLDTGNIGVRAIQLLPRRSGKQITLRPRKTIAIYFITQLGPWQS